MMKNHVNRLVGLILVASATCQPTLHARDINYWRGDESGANWNDPYKWKLKHPPAGDEAAHFRERNSLVNINNNIYLNNGMHLYGEELCLRGNGTINLPSAVPHERTVNVPASADGQSTLVLADNLSLNGRLSLAAKGFGTADCTGILVLKDRATITGALCIGNAGRGNGQVVIQDNATYRVTDLELSTDALKGGSAVISVSGGTLRIETKENPFEVFLADASRKIVLGDAGTLRIESSLPTAVKQQMIKQMIVNKRLVAAPGFRLTPPVINEKMLVAIAEDSSSPSSYDSEEALLAAIGNPTMQIASIQKPALANGTMVRISAMAPAPDAAPQPATTASIPAISETSQGGTRLAGYVVFLGTALLALRRMPDAETAG